MDKQSEKNELLICEKCKKIECGDCTYREIAREERTMVDLYNQEMKELQDSQKQIEEMAKVLDGDCGECYTCKYFESKGINCTYLLGAEYLYNAGYRKIPENAVVLTETEYNDLLSDEVKTIERDIAEYWATEEVATVAKELHKEGYRKIDDHAILVLRKAKCLEQKIRKETAEKFAERVKMAFYYEFDELIPSIMADKIDEICKEITDKEVQNGN